MDKRTDGRMDEQKSPCVPQDFVPFGAAPAFLLLLLLPSLLPLLLPPTSLLPLLSLPT